MKTFDNDIEDLIVRIHSRKNLFHKYIYASSNLRKTIEYVQTCVNYFFDKTVDARRLTIHMNEFMKCFQQ